MVFGDSLTKAGRLVELQRAFWKRPGCVVSTGELARQINVAPRTVRKYLRELSGSGSLPIYREGRGWKLAEDARLEILPVRFQLEEAASVYLASRLLLRHAGESSSAVHNAVSKLALVVPAGLRVACSRLAERYGAEVDVRSESVFRSLVYGWVFHRLVNVVYESRTRGEPQRLDLRPYLIEPAAVGSAVYVVGRADPPGEIRVMKLARVLEARLLQASFEPPPEGELLDRLDQAWAIWMTEDDPVKVRLRFSREVAGRVRETRWHPSQRLEANPDGTLDMELTIASTVEIVNWILGWGPACRVLEPEDLRHHIAGELMEAAKLYS